MEFFKKKRLVQNALMCSSLDFYGDFPINGNKNLGVADLGYKSFYLQFLKPRLKLTFRYMQN
jgi:hypothetical protein